MHVCVCTVLLCYICIHVDPAVVQKREDAVLAARERMQHLAERNSVIAEEKRRETEEEKQAMRAEEWENHRMFGQGLNNKSKPVEKKPVRPMLNVKKLFCKEHHLCKEAYV